MFLNHLASTIGLRSFLYHSARLVPRNYVIASSLFRTSPMGVRSTQLFQYMNFSAKTVPPPPPPNPPKNEKGIHILNKISRFLNFSFSTMLVAVALLVTGVVFYLIFAELFLPSGQTKTFNKALKVIQSNEVAQKALNFAPGERLKAYGDIPGDKWARNRPMQSAQKTGHDGKKHMFLRFHVESDSGKHATVMVEQVDTSFWNSEFAYIALDLENGKRAYVVEPKFSRSSYVTRGSTSLGSGNGFLGLNWGPKRD